MFGKRVWSLLGKGIFLCTLVLLMGNQKVQAQSITVAGTQDYKEAFEVVELVNKERAAKGLEPLTMDQELLKVANLRSAEVKFYFSHTRPDGSDCFTAIPKTYKMSCGENIAIGQDSAADVMKSWMTSTGHRENILGTKYKSIGVGCFYQSGHKAWVQVFSSTAPAAVSKSGTESKTVTLDVQDSTVSPSISGTKKVSVGDTKTYRIFCENVGWTLDETEVASDLFQFTSSNSSVASINESGKLTAKANGTVLVTAAWKGNSAKKATLTVTVGTGKEEESTTKKEESSASSGETTVTVPGTTKKVKISKPVIKKVSAGKKKFSVTFKSGKSRDGYQIAYCLNKKFKRGVKKHWVKKSSVKVTVSKLKKKRTYYVKIRAYKKVGKKKVYGSWSKVKKIKTK